MDGQGTTWRRNIAENFNRLSRVHQRYRRQTTDRQTDGPSMTNSEHELEFTFAKNRFASVSLSVCVSVRLRALSRSHFLIDFHQNWQRLKNPQKEERVRWELISNDPFPYFDPQNPNFRPKGPENPCKY